MQNDYSFLDFYYDTLGGSIVPVTRDEERRPVIKWKTKTLTKEELKKRFPLTRYNYAFLIPDGVAVIDVEAHKEGIRQTAELKEKTGIDLLSTFHNISGQGGIHSYFKLLKSTPKLPNGYPENYPGIEIRPPGTLITIPPSIHANGKPYKQGTIPAQKSKLKSFPKEILAEFKYKNAGKDLDDKTKDARRVEVVLQGKVDELKNWLTYLSPLDYGDFAQWVKIMFSAYDLVQGDLRGLDVFKAWSKLDPRYENDDARIETLWKNVAKIKQDKDDPRNLITWKTLAYLASKAGAKIKANTGKLIDEVLKNTFSFISTNENDGEYVRDIREGKLDIFKGADKEEINGEKWTRLTEGVINRIQGYIFDESGILRKEFTLMRIKDYLERNRVSIFRTAWEKVEVRYGRDDIEDLDDLQAMKEVFFKHIIHKDPDHAKRVFPFFVKYLVSGVMANLSEFDNDHRSNTQTCLCISSDRQGIGKSTFARALTPCPSMVYYPNLRDIRSMEVKLAIARASLCIIDDYQPTFQKELNNLNEILTQHHILVRPKYGRIEISKTKRAYFALTTNYKKILNDFTGSRRWINLDLTGMNIDKILELMPKVHGEMISLARAGFRHWFTASEIDELEKLNQPFSGTETLDHILLNHYEECENDAYMFTPAIDIMKDINKAYGSQTIRDVRQLGASITRLFSNADTKRKKMSGQKLTVYSLRLKKPFHNGDIIIQGSGVKSA